MNQETKAALTERQRYWLEHVRSCESSDISIAEYCATHDLKPQSMYAGKKNWLRKACCAVLINCDFNGRRSLILVLLMNGASSYPMGRWFRLLAVLMFKR